MHKGAQMSLPPQNQNDEQKHKANMASEEGFRLTLAQGIWIFRCIMLPDREGLMALVLWPDVQLVQLNTDSLEISGAVAAYPRQGSGPLLWNPI